MKALAVVLVPLALLFGSCGGNDLADGPPQLVAAQGYAPNLFADVYLPTDGGQRRPAVLLVHGGGFSGGGRQDMAGYAQDLAKRGIVAATIDYRLSNGQWFPADRLDDPGLRAAAGEARDDATGAVRWLRANADRFGLDPSRITVAGYSAGGITAVEVATHDPNVDGAVAIAGAGMDLTALDKGDPPLLLLHGTADGIIPIKLAEQTCDAAKLADAPCELRRFDGVNHDIGAVRESDMVDAIARFAERAKPRGAG